jgi:hypothetical protein
MSAIDPSSGPDLTTQATKGLGPPVPSPAYRDRVHLGLARPAPGRHWWHTLARPHTYRGHPSAWLAAGALAATLLLLAGQAAFGPSIKPPGLPAPGSDAATATELYSTPAPTQKTGSMARIWADLHTPEHLERVRADEQRRKQRQDDRRLVHGEERSSRGPTQ